MSHIFCVINCRVIGKAHLALQLIINKYTLDIKIRDKVIIEIKWKLPNQIK